MLNELKCRDKQRGIREVKLILKRNKKLKAKQDVKLIKMKAEILQISGQNQSIIRKMLKLNEVAIHKCKVKQRKRFHQYMFA